MPTIKKPNWSDIMKGTPQWDWFLYRREQYRSLFQEEVSSRESARLAAGDAVRRDMDWWRQHGGTALSSKWYTLAKKSLGALPIPVLAPKPSGRPALGYDGSEEWVKTYEAAALADMDRFGSLLDSDFGDYDEGKVPEAKSTEWTETIKPLPKREDVTLRSANAFRGKTASPRDTVTWVADNLSVKDVTPEDCPCPAAWALLRYTLTGPTQEKTFWDIWGRFLPTRGQIEKEAELNHGGREPLDDLEKFMVEEEWLETHTLVVDGNGRKR